MKIFISWSSGVSNKVAQVLREWLPSVIQAIEPYVSSEDIDKGARWSTDIAKELEASRYGILCVTHENVDAPWLNFEAGALSKTIDKSRVCPFLFGLKRSEIRTGPLLQFQSTIYERDDISKLLHSMNCAAETKCIDEGRLDSVFGVWWPKLKESLDPLLHEASKASHAAEKGQPASNQAGQNEILEELLDLARNQQKLLNSPESLLPPPYLEQLVRSVNQFADVSPMALADLERSWKMLSDFLKGLKEGEPIPSNILNDMVEEMGPPILYILRRAGPRLGRGARGRFSAET
jgi:hypothetical protein